MTTQTKAAPARRINVRKLVILAVLSAIAYLTVFFIRIPMVEFLKYEPKDVIITIAAFLFGPLAACRCRLSSRLSKWSPSVPPARSAC